MLFTLGYCARKRRCQMCSQDWLAVDRYCQFQSLCLLDIRRFASTHSDLDGEQADRSSFRKPLLLTFAAIGAFSASLFLPLSSASPACTVLLRDVGFHVLLNSNCVFRSKLHLPEPWIPWSSVVDQAQPTLPSKTPECCPQHSTITCGIWNLWDIMHPQQSEARSGNRTRKSGSAAVGRPRSQVPLILHRSAWPHIIS